MSLTLSEMSWILTVSEHEPFALEGCCSLEGQVCHLVVSQPPAPTSVSFSLPRPPPSEQQGELSWTLA